jgi:hypothetical protein
MNSRFVVKPNGLAPVDRVLWTTQQELYMTARALGVLATAHAPMGSGHH